MKTLTIMMVLVFALSISGCVTTQGGSGASSSSGAKMDSAPAKSSGSKSGGMLTKEDYDRMGVKEMGTR